MYSFQCLSQTLAIDVSIVKGVLCWRWRIRACRANSMDGRLLQMISISSKKTTWKTPPSSTRNDVVRWLKGNLTEQNHIHVNDQLICETNTAFSRHFVVLLNEWNRWQRNVVSSWQPIFLEPPVLGNLHRSKYYRISSHLHRHWKHSHHPTVTC